jgi:hypothetical protein
MRNAEPAPALYIAKMDVQGYIAVPKWITLVLEFRQYI